MLKNDDFSKMLTSTDGRTDRAGLLKIMDKEQRIKKQRAVTNQRRGGDDEDDEGYGDFSDDDDETGRRKHKGRQQEPQQEKKVVKDDAKSGYRDRAEERRKGVNPDYDDEVTRLVDMDAEKTKYLGGDLKHTHLVKGLDYALLQKVRAELATEEEGEQGVAVEEKGGEARDRKRRSMEAVQTRTLLGKGIKFFLAKAYSSDKVKPLDVFKTTALEYTVDAEDRREELPTLVSRSKAEVEAADESPLMLYRLPDPLLRRLGKALADYRQLAASRKKHRKRKQHAQQEYGQAASTKKPVLLVDDIFGGGSTDDANGQGQGQGQGQGKAKGAGLGRAASGSYFSGLSAKEEQEQQQQAGADEIDRSVEQMLRKAGLGKKEAAEGLEEGEEAPAGGSRRERRAAKRQQGKGEGRGAVPDLFAGLGGAADRKAQNQGIALTLAGEDEDYMQGAGEVLYDSDEERMKKKKLKVKD